MVIARRLALLGTFSAAVTLTIAQQAPRAQVESAQNACAPSFHEDSIFVNGFIFKTFQQLTPTQMYSCIEIVQSGRVVFRRTEDGGEFILGQKAQPEFGIPGITQGTDVTGRGHPDMIDSYYSGGGHCCTSVLLFELEPNLSLLSKLEVGDSDISHFERDLPHAGYRFITWDEPFAYWHTSFAESPMPKLILKPVSDEKVGLSFKLDLKEMRRKPPSDREWTNNYLAHAKSAFAPHGPVDGEYPSSDLWKPMLDWIYGGQADWAWKLVDAAWPTDRPGKDQFLKEFCGQLAQSPYWLELRLQVGRPPASCATGIADSDTKQH